MQYPSIAVAALLALSPAVVSAEGFDGPYVGLQFGTAEVDTNVGVTGDDDLLGVHAGLLLSTGALVYGAEIDFDELSVPLSGGSGELDTVSRLKLRGGYDLGGALVYGTTGFAHARTSDLGDDNGYFFGLGAEFDLPAPGRVGVEYLSHAFDEFDGSAVDVDADTFTLRYSFNF